MYDVTSTYFEGDMEGCPISKRGYSRDSRPDRPQVCIGLIVTEDGFPLGHEVFAGNTHDSTTVRGMIEAMEKKYGQLGRNLGDGPGHGQRREPGFLTGA